MSNTPLGRSDTNFADVRTQKKALPFWFDIDLSTARSKSAGTAFIANCAGNAFYVDADPADGTAVVSFQDTNLGSSAYPAYISPGYIAYVPFTQLIFENEAQPGKKIRIAYGVDIDFQPGSVAQFSIAGTVSVIDGEKSRTLAGGMYAGAPFCVPTAGQYGYVQLWNPVASGKNLIVGSLGVGLSANGSFAVFFSNVQLTGASSFAVANKRPDGAAAVGLLRFESKVAAPTYPLGCLLNQYALASEPSFWAVKGALVVPPGYGLTVASQPVTLTLTSNCEWFEEDI